MRIFKYLTPQGAVATLENCSLRSRHPDFFNDPFEMEVDCGFQTAEQIEATYMEPRAIKTRWQKKGLPRGQSFDEFEREWISSLPRRIEIRLGQQLMGQPLIPLGMRRRTIAKSWFIYCAARTPTSILMWSHYAKDHKGAVVELESTDFPSEIALTEVTYSMNRPKHELGSFPADIEEKMLMEAIGTKALPWAYEEEVRCMVPIPRGLTENFHDVHLPASAIKRVILGVGADLAFQSDMETLLSNARYAAVVRQHAKKHAREYTLELLDGFISHVI